MRECASRALPRFALRRRSAGAPLPCEDDRERGAPRRESACVRGLVLTQSLFALSHCARRDHRRDAVGRPAPRLGDGSSQTIATSSEVSARSQAPPRDGSNA
jgi:hypothetical protein